MGGGGGGGEGGQTKREIDDHFYIALFSTLEQTHCAFAACDSE